MNTAPEPPIVQTPDDLAMVIEALAGSEPISLDTEFHAERRYRPELMLLQLSTPHGPVFTIDPLAVDLTPLGPILDGRPWLAHGAHWDLYLIHQATGARPSVLMDTQILAGMAGLSYPARLDVLTRTALGTELDKGATLSNWKQRPLDPEQLAYACADVRLLCPIWDALTTRAVKLDNSLSQRDGCAWAIEAGTEAIATALDQPDPHHHWRHLDIAPQLDGPTRQVLHGLFTWREKEARRRNSPPHYILAPSIALDLARRRPLTEAGLRANRRIPSGLIKRHRDELLETIKEAMNTPVPAPVPDHHHGGRLALLTAWSQITAEQLCVAPRLLVPKDLLRAISARGVKALKGWRSRALGDSLRDLLAGRTALAMTESNLVQVRTGKSLQN
jgi:ribonuclease D